MADLNRIYTAQDYERLRLSIDERSVNQTDEGVITLRRLFRVVSAAAEKEGAGSGKMYDVAYRGASLIDQAFKQFQVSPQNIIHRMFDAMFEATRPRNNPMFAATMPTNNVPALQQIADHFADLEKTLPILAANRNVAARFVPVRDPS